MRQLLLCVGVVALGATMVGVTARADDAAPAPDDGTSLPAVVVTATRTAQSVDDVPASIDSVSMADHPDTLGVNPSEFLDGVPGVVARDRQNYAQDEQISIRGFGARSTFGVRGVRLYTDGIPATQPDGQGQVSNFNLDSADRIEVLRGPFSALYGNSSGGVIQIFTADGTDPPQVDVGVAVASYDTLRASANARGIAGPVNYNLDVTHFETDGYRDHSAANRESGNAKVAIAISPTAKLTLIANTVALPNAQDPLGLTRAQFESDPSGVASGALLYNTRKTVHQAQGGAIYEQDFGSGNSLRVLGYYGRRDIEQFLSIPASAQASPKSAGGVVDLGGNYGGTDARWTYAGTLGDRPFEITAGFAYDKQDQSRFGYENFVGDLLGVRGALRRDEDDTVFDFDQYAQATWRFTDAWSLTAGLRHSQVKFNSDDHYITAGNPDDSGHVDYGATTPVAGLLWKIDDRANAYVSFGRGFETPTFNELGYRSDGEGGLAFDLVPSRSRNGEFGIKLRPLDDLTANFAVFRADTRDELAVATSSGGRTTYQNIGKARRQGTEASAVWRIAPLWKLDLAYTYLDATFRSPFLTCVTSGCTTPNTPVDAGARIPGIPKTDLHLGLAWGGDIGWRATLAGEYVGSVSVNDIGSDRAPSYVDVGASVAYGFELASGSLRTYLRLDNAFDRAYAGSVIVNDSNGRYFEPAPGRTVMVGAQWNWSGG